MRKIEKEMLAAIAARKDFFKDNTLVVFSDHNGNPYLSATVYLHGHSIAYVLPGGLIEVNKDTLADWPTRTTCSRLRALGVSVNLKQGLPHIDGELVTGN